MQSMMVETPIGTLIIKESNDIEFPGVWIDLRRPDVGYDMSVALVEYCDCEDYEGTSEHKNLVTRVWGNAMQDDYTHRVIHEGIEEYFKIEERGV